MMVSSVLADMSGDHSECEARGRGRLSLDQILELLGQYQRRAIVRHLRDSPARATPIDEVVDFLADLERERTGEAPGEDHLLSVLMHIHGPKLEEAGLVDYDVPDRDIWYYPNERVETLLDRIEEWEERN